jgi:transcriptional regulator with XRE-family HTH domain|nr:MAG TPA: helix-turn-helix domain protein [Caudoviricetes sp.]
MKRILDGQKQNMVGPRIKQLRLEKGMTQKTLAERLEILAVYVCRGSISRIEEQKRTITDIELIGIAEVLQVDISELFKKDE